MGTAAKTRKNPYAKLIAAYYQTLKDFKFQDVWHEGAVSTAFETLLADAARSNHWTLIPFLGDKASGNLVIPDATLKDQMLLVRGHLEAKDTDDNLDEEIAKKIKKGYPRGNIIFEDTRSAVLIQNKNEVMRVDLRDPETLASLLRTFFDYTEPQIESFEKAITEFKERVPELAKALKDKILTAHEQNRPFKEAFTRFFALCQTSLNPNIAKDAVDDMLVQHLLTERLIREIFDNPEFTRRNVIAAEIEKVIDALTSRAFNRDVFLKSLDRFYIAIENAARTITEWSDKQHFLNTVYERFFQGYSVKLADTMGIIYTPQPIVDFMCASVVEVLKEVFGKSLGDEDVYLLDPCTGTANFVVNLMRRMPKRDLPRMYRQQMFANEIMLLPYYIAALNIEHAYYELTGEYEPFEGLCFVDTLDLAESHQAQMSFMTAKNTERVERQKRTPITVIVGNPPYNSKQLDESDNNQNRAYPVVDRRINETYAVTSTATLTNKLYDPYVKFFRWAIDRLGDRPGIVAFVTNNSFIDQLAFDGMRKSLLEDFSSIYHLNLQGNVRHNPKLSGSAYNVFGIQVGVGITIAIRAPKSKQRPLYFAEVAEDLPREEKLQWLGTKGSRSGVDWKALKPDADHNWLTSEHTAEYKSFLPIGDKDAKTNRGINTTSIFTLFSLGIVTSRDSYAYSFQPDRLLKQAETFVEVYNTAVDKLKRGGAKLDADTLVDVADPRIKWTRQVKASLKRAQYSEFDKSHLRSGHYRPFTKQFVYFDDFWNEEQYQQRAIFPSTASENVAICATGAGAERPFASLVTSIVPDLNFFGPGTVPQWYPFDVYDADGTNRRENITDWALEQFRTHYKDKKISKWDIFHYVYGLLHHPGYRTKFADNLKRELPRIPFAPDFRAFQRAGQSLADLHLDYEQLDPWKLKWIETPGVPLSYLVEKMKLVKPKATEGYSDESAKEKKKQSGGEGAKLIVNDSLTLAAIPPEVFEYRLGNRSALEWVVDQYQVSTDKRSGIVSDPNREDDPEYIVRLVGQAVRVSVETVRIVTALPERFA